MGTGARLLAVGVVAVVGGLIYWLFAVPQAAPAGIIVLQANYGANCAGVAPPNGAANRYVAGNATAFADRICRGSTSCSIPVDAGVLGDPVGGCLKDFVVAYLCAQGGAVKTAHLDGEANGNTLAIACDSK